jgi:hypothetical protein
MSREFPILRASPAKLSKLKNLNICKQPHDTAHGMAASTSRGKIKVNDLGREQGFLVQRKRH